VIHFGGSHEVEGAAGCTLPRIPGTEHEARDARVRHGGCAHRAGLKSHVEGRAAQPVFACTGCGFAQREHLGMSRGVSGRDRTIPALAQHGVVPNDECADGYFSFRLGLNRKLERTPHP